MTTIIIKHPPNNNKEIPLNCYNNTQLSNRELLEIAERQAKEQKQKWLEEEKEMRT